jgi:hypothetical protein
MVIVGKHGSFHPIHTGKRGGKFFVVKGKVRYIGKKYSDRIYWI